MDDALFTAGFDGGDGDLDFSEYRLTPSPEDLTPDSVARKEKREEFSEALDRLGDRVETVVFTHTDADGLTSGALLAYMSEKSRGNYTAPSQNFHERGFKSTVVLPVDYTDPYSFEEALADLDGWIGGGPSEIYISDFNADPGMAEETADTFASLGETADIRWFDHHQWEDESIDILDDVGVEILLDTDECAASLIHREEGVDGEDEDEWPDHLSELVAVTKDRDLWIREDPRSERLNAFSHVADSPNEYMATVLNDGVEWGERVDERIGEYLDRQRRLETAAVLNATRYFIQEPRDIPDRDHSYIAFTYSRGGRPSVIGNRLVENDEETIVAFVARPDGISVYSHSTDESYDYCHLVARSFGGGGHPTASGFPIPVKNGRRLTRYWASAGTFVTRELTQRAAEILYEESKEADTDDAKTSGWVKTVEESDGEDK